MSRQFPILARIDRDAISHNCNVLKSLLPDDCKFSAVVKCNAYGHGVDIVVPVLEEAGAEMLCVATISEAEQLRVLGWDKSILLLMPEFDIYSGKDKSEMARHLVKNEFRVTAVSLDDIRVLNEAAEDLSKPTPIHLMLDTGMSRLGVMEETLIELIDATRNTEYVQLEGIYTHFASSHAADKTFANAQLQRFNSFLDRLTQMGVKFPLIHAANSGAVIDLPDSYFNMVRPGLSLYGYYPDKELHNKPDIKPAMKLVSFLTIVKKIKAGSYVGYGCTYQAEKDMTIGLVPIGYGDGYDRRFSNSGIMTIEGHEAPVIGRVSMDQTIVNLDNVVAAGIDIHAGSEITVIDSDRDAINSVESLADQIDTIPYEIVTNLGDRILRV